MGCARFTERVFVVDTSKPISIRRFHELQVGDIFRATIQNIRPGEVTLRFVGGETFTARSKVLPEARINEESLFRVKENDFQGKIVLEFVRRFPGKIISFDMRV